MTSETLLLGILPLLAFVVMDSFFGLKTGLMAAILLAAIELFYTLSKFGTLDLITGLSVFLVFLMSYFAWKKDSEKLFLFQPVIMSFFLGSYLIFSYLISKPLFNEVYLKYGRDLMDQQQRTILESPLVQKQMALSSLTCGVMLYFHAALTWFAAIKLGKWWWIAVRGVGFYIFMLIGMFWAKAML